MTEIETSIDCGVCGDESGGEFVGVAAVPDAPLSVGWCRECLTHNAVPRYVVETWLFGDLELPLPTEPPPISAFASWVVDFTVWIDGQYMQFMDAVPILWRDEIAASNER